MFKLFKFYYQRDSKKILITCFVIFSLLYFFFYKSSVTTVSKVENKEIGRFKNYITITLGGSGEKEKISVPKSTYSLVETNKTYFITYHHNFIRGNYIKNLKISEPLNNHKNNVKQTNK